MILTVWNESFFIKQCSLSDGFLNSFQFKKSVDYSES